MAVADDDVEAPNLKPPVLGAVLAAVVPAPNLNLGAEDADDDPAPFLADVPGRAASHARHLFTSSGFPEKQPEQVHCCLA